MGETRCPVCGGNDKDAPCAYPSEGHYGCLRDLRLKETRMSELPMWTIYKNPSDYPGMYVARKWIVRNGREERTATVITDVNLERLRDSLPAGLFCIKRAPEDDPVIVETWL